MTYGGTKRAVFELLEAAGPKGASLAALLDAARARGLELNRGSVSSMLSRLARDGTLDYTPQQPERYRLRE